MNYQWVADNAALAAMCQQLSSAQVVGLDTEFMRVSTYYPMLALMQFSAFDQVWLVDPLAINQRQPLIELLASDKICWVLHACSEDLEALQFALGQQPKRIFDTQIAAAFVGYGASIGYGRLVEAVFSQSLDNSQTRSDWFARPLSPLQLRYAADDAHFLIPLYQHLQQRLTELGWSDACAHECSLLGHKVEVPFELEYREFKRAWQLNSRQLAVLKPLVEWRLELAKRQNLALGRVIKDDVLWQLAASAPSDVAGLQRYGVPPVAIRRYGHVLLSLIANARQIPANQLPALVKRTCDHPDYRDAYKALKQQVEHIAERQAPQLPLQLLAPKRLLNEYLAVKWQLEEAPLNARLTSGWRAQIFATLK